MIDNQMSELILDHLNYTLEDLSLEYGDVAIEDDEISHQLYYNSNHSSCNLIGYVYHCNDVYYTALGFDNYSNPYRAALDLLNKHSVSVALAAIVQHQIITKEYF